MVDIRGEEAAAASVGEGAEAAETPRGGGGFGIRPECPITIGPGGFVYFPISSQRTWVGPRPAGEGSKTARAGA